MGPFFINRLSELRRCIENRQKTQTSDFLAFLLPFCPQPPPASLSPSTILSSVPTLPSLTSFGSGARMSVGFCLPAFRHEPTVLISHTVPMERVCPLFCVHSRKKSWPSCALPLSARLFESPPGLAHLSIAISCGFILRFWCIAFDPEYIFSTKGRVQ